MDPYPSRCAKQFTQSRHTTAWQLIKSYWQSDQRFPAYLFFSIVMVMTVSLVGLYVIFTYWYNYYYDVLQAYDDHGFMRLIIVSSILVLFYVLMAVYHFYISQFVEQGWRRWLMNRCAGLWLQKRGSCSSSRRKAKNRGKREEQVKNEIAVLINFSIDFSMELIGVLTALIAFCYYLWLLTGDFSFRFGPMGVFEIPSYVICMGLVCGLIVLMYTLKRTRPIFPEHFDQGQRAMERSILSKRFFGRWLDNPWLALLRQKLTFCFSAGYSQAGVILPLVIVLPDYFDKVFLISWLVQYLQMFTRGQSSMSCILNSYPVYKSAPTGTIAAQV